MDVLNFEHMRYESSFWKAFISELYSWKDFPSFVVEEDPFLFRFYTF